MPGAGDALPIAGVDVAPNAGVDCWKGDPKLFCCALGCGVPKIRNKLFYTSHVSNAMQVILSTLLHVTSVEEIP